MATQSGAAASTVVPTQWKHMSAPQVNVDAVEYPWVKPRNVAVGGTGEDRFRELAIAPGQVVRPERQVAEDEGRVTRPRALDVAELPPNTSKLEDGASALERVLGLRELARLERRGQGVVGNGHRRGQWMLLLLGRCGMAASASRSVAKQAVRPRPRIGDPACRICRMKLY